MFVLLISAASPTIAPVVNNELRPEDLSSPRLGDKAEYIQVISEFSSDWVSRVEVRHELDVIEVGEKTYTVNHTISPLATNGPSRIHVQESTAQYVVDRTLHMPTEQDSRSEWGYPAFLMFAGESLFDLEQRIVSGKTWQINGVEFAAIAGTMADKSVFEILCDIDVTKSSYIIRQGEWPALVECLTMIVEELELSATDTPPPIIYYPSKPEDDDVPPSINRLLDSVSIFRKVETRLKEDTSE